MNCPDSKPPVDLVADYFLRDLSEAELVQLQRNLQAEDSVRRAFATAGRDEWLMHHVHHMDEARLIHFSTRKKRVNRIRAIAAGVAVLVSLGVLFLANRTSISLVASANSSAEVVAKVSGFYVLEGSALTAVNSGRVRTLRNASELRAGDLVQVPHGGRLSFVYLNDGSHMSFATAATFELAETGGAKRIVLRNGTLLATVAKQPSGSPMVIRTDDAEVEVLGTVFELLAGELTRLTVRSGSVAMDSLVTGERVMVDAGFFAESTGRLLQIPKPMKLLSLKPVDETTLNMRENNPQFIAVDPVRNYHGLLQFDLGEIGGRVLEATLKLRVMNHHNDCGGDGTVRVYSVDSGSRDLTPKASDQISFYTGKVGAGMDLEFELDPESLGDGRCLLLLTLDEGGNDFWFSSSKGTEVPQLNLKIVGKE